MQPASIACLPALGIMFIALQDHIAHVGDYVGEDSLLEHKVTEPFLAVGARVITSTVYPIDPKLPLLMI